MMKRLIFPVLNALVFVMLFAVIGYYIFDPVRWMIIGLGVGLSIGLLVELGLGLIGGWVYRRRVTLAVLFEVILIIAFVGPFILVFLQTTPQHNTICCIENSGLGDQVEAVSIPVADGETLAGWYAPPTDEPGAVIMILHGSRGDRTGSLAHARVLQEAGFGVLVYDQRASGESTGERQSIGWYDQRDITPIIDWLGTRPEVEAERIGGVGLSLGGQILIMAAPHEPRLKAIWADGIGINSISDVPDFEGFDNAFARFINQQVYWLAEIYLGTQGMPFKQAIPQIAPRHLTLVASGTAPYEADFNRGYETLLGENSDLWVIEDAHHVGGIQVHPDEYTTRMIAFFDEALRQES
jgi:pimeloyl-ACP methyl ester carboxylesterase